MAEYAKERQDLEYAISKMKAQLETESSKKEQYEHFFELLESVQHVEELTPDLLKKLIERIEVEQGYYEKDQNGKRIKRQSIRIYYRFIGCLDDVP